MSFIDGLIHIFECLNKNLLEKQRWRIVSVHLKKDICTIVNGEDQCSNSGQVTGPGESHQGNGSHVMDEHLPEVLPFDVKKLKTIQ